MKKTQLIAALLSAAMLQSSIAGAVEGFAEIQNTPFAEMNFGQHGGGRGGGGGGFQPPQRQEPRQQPSFPRQQEPRRDFPRQQEPRRDFPRQDFPRQQPSFPRQQPQQPSFPRQEPRQPSFPRQEPPRREPPVQMPPRQQPPRREPPTRIPPQQPPRQEPPRREPPTRIPPQQPPRQEPPRRQPPTRIPPQQPPRQEPPRQEPPRRQPPTRIPPQQPPRQEPPRREPPRREPPTRIPPTNRPPQRPPVHNPPGHERPPVNRPPVVVHPRPEPGRPGRVDMPRREPIRDRDRIMDPRRNGWDVNRPHQFPDGRPINNRPVVRGPHGDHITIINNTTVINNVRNYNRWETDHNRYYWHDYNGNRYCHYYDSWGFHWYGWYIADVYFWTRYWNDMYWWYDPYYHRWVYMRDGRWWWQDPARVEVVYLYTPETNTYYQYDNAPGGGVVMTPDPTTPVEAPPADPSEPSTTPAQQPQKIFMSADGRRSVQIFGEKNDAFLYDTAETPSFDPVYLASGATEARFSQTADDQPITVLLLTEEKADDGTVTKSFKMYDENGNDMSQATQPTPAPVAPPSDDNSGGDTPSPSSTLNSLKANLGSFNWN